MLEESFQVDFIVVDLMFTEKFIESKSMDLSLSLMED